MRVKKFPFFRQHDQYDCGPTCIRIIAKYYGKSFTSEHLRHVCNITMEGTSARGIVEGAESIGFQALPALINYDTLRDELPLPCICYWRDRHFIVVYKVTKKKVYVSDPLHGLLSYTKDEFIKGWQNRKDTDVNNEGIVIFLEPTPDFYRNPGDKNPKGIRKILSYLAKDKKYLIQISFGLIAATIIQFIFPFLTQAIVDKGIATQDLNFIYVILLAQITLFLSSSMFSFVQNWLLLFVGSRASIMIATDYLRKLLKKPLSFFDSKTAGDILQRINDSTKIETLISNAPYTIFSYLNAFVFLLVIFYYDTTIFIIFVIGILLYVFWVQFFMKKRAELDFKRFDENASTNTSLMQIVNGISEVKVNNSELRRVWAWEEIRVRLHKTAVANLKLAQIQQIGGTTINELKNIIITFLAAKGVIDGDLTLGMMLAIQYIVGQINTPLNNTLTFIRELQDAKLSVDRFSDIDFVTDEEVEMNKKDLLSPKNEPEDIVFEDLSFRYGGPQSPMVLKNINLTIPKGKVTAIVGMSGGGKTTLLKLLLKLYLPTAGKLKIGSLDIRSVDSYSWRALCGTVMQNGYIFTDTVSRNITESNPLGYYDEQKILEAVDIANIRDFIEDHPAGYNARIGPPGSSGRSLSGGQAQRILLARAVYKDPKYIFLDEATSALDANNEMKIMENLNKFYIGKTVVIIAHRLSTVKDADQIVVLKDGEVVETGQHEDLITKEGHYYTLVKNQLEVGK